MEIFSPEWNKKLIDFLGNASESTYASSEGKKLEKSSRPESEDYLYEDGNWKYLDSYVWNKDGGGEEIIYFKDKPVWVMNYYGYLIETKDSKTVYSFLKEALSQKHPDLPVRGKNLEDEERSLRYNIIFEKKDIGNFIGKEMIFQNGKIVYECYIHGGFIK